MGFLSDNGHALAVMHIGIANPQWWEKRSRHSRRMRNPQFYVFGKRPVTDDDITMQGVSASSGMILV